MSHRRKHPALERFRDSIIKIQAVSVLLGGVCTIAAAAVMAAVMYRIIGLVVLEGLFAGVSLTAGGFAGGYVRGRQLHRRGLAGGALTGVLMYTVLAAAGLILSQGMPEMKKLVVLAVSGAAGGVAGVNGNTR